MTVALLPLANRSIHYSNNNNNNSKQIRGCKLINLFKKELKSFPQNFQSFSFNFSFIMRGVLEGVEILSEVLYRWPHARMWPREGTALPDWSPVSQRHFKAVRGATIVLEWADHIIVLHTSKKTVLWFINIKRSSEEGTFVMATSLLGVSLRSFVLV